MITIRAFLLVPLIAALSPVHTRAHDIYHGLTNTLGESCCHGSDCRPAKYRLMAHGLEMFVNGDWIKVPADKIQYRTLAGDNGESAGGHWCGYTELRNVEDETGIHRAFCAVLPPNIAARDE